jgi:drug/metabolite transporter (DMT)-like permease
MQTLTGALLIVISAASFGTLAIFGRYAYAAGLDTFTLLAIRFSVSALLMAALLRGSRQPLPRGRVLLQLVGMGAIGYVGQSFCYLTAIRFASAGLVALLLYLYPVMVALLSAFFYKERFGSAKVAALLFATLGAALTANPEGGSWTGALLAFASAVIYSVYIIVGAGVLRQVSSFQSSTVIFASAGFVYILLASLRGPHPPRDLPGWGVMLAIILVATVIPVVTFLAGLKRIGPTNASLLSTLEPVVTVLLATALFGERLSPLALAGGFLILVAVALLTRGELAIPKTA